MFAKFLKDFTSTNKKSLPKNFTSDSKMKNMFTYDYDI